MALGDLDGDGAFHGESPLFPVARKTYSIAWTPQWLDQGFTESIRAAIGNEGEPNTIHWNDGRGGFDLTSTFGTGDDNTRAVRAADLDADGDLDLVVGNLSADS